MGAKFSEDSTEVIIDKVTLFEEHEFPREAIIFSNNVPRPPLEAQK